MCFWSEPSGFQILMDFLMPLLFPFLLCPSVVLLLWNLHHSITGQRHIMFPLWVQWVIVWSSQCKTVPVLLFVSHRQTRYLFPRFYFLLLRLPLHLFLEVYLVEFFPCLVRVSPCRCLYVRNIFVDQLYSYS